jgi:hypothetical protein
MGKTIGDLWHGRLPLGRAFWEFAVIYGLILNVLSTTASLLAIAGNLSWIAILLIHFLPAPYWIASTVGVWRSADRYAGPPRWASAARVAALLWLLLMLVT